jgi:hypothetical protein
MTIGRSGDSGADSSGAAAREQVAFVQVARHSQDASSVVVSSSSSSSSRRFGAATSAPMSVQDSPAGWRKDERSGVWHLASDDEEHTPEQQPASDYSGAPSLCEAEAVAPAVHAELGRHRSGYADTELAHQFEWCLVFTADAGGGAAGAHRWQRRADQHLASAAWQPVGAGRRGGSGGHVGDGCLCSMDALRTRFEELGLTCTVPPPTTGSSAEHLFLLVGAGEVGSREAEELLKNEAERTGFRKAVLNIEAPRTAGQPGGTVDDGRWSVNGAGHAGRLLGYAPFTRDNLQWFEQPDHPFWGGGGGGGTEGKPPPCSRLFTSGERQQLVASVMQRAEWAAFEPLPAADGDHGDAPHHGHGMRRGQLLCAWGLKPDTAPAAAAAAAADHAGPGVPAGRFEPDMYAAPF